MSEGTYTKNEVAQVLGLNEKEFNNFIYSDLFLPIKEIYSFTELLLLKELKKVYDKKKLPKKIAIISIIISSVISVIVTTWVFFVSYGESLFISYNNFVESSILIPLFGENSGLFLLRKLGKLGLIIFSIIWLIPLMFILSIVHTAIEDIAVRLNLKKEDKDT
tara:strand:- start:97 stop:585 length:489 start_codon:yes stop_codon:yes gene_type:complete